MDPLLMMAKVARLCEQGGIDATFVGGTVLAMLVDEVSREDLRATQDVDVIVRADSYEAYQAECFKLMRVGFQPGQEDGDPLCRYRGKGVVVDLMPTPYGGMGTDNPWFGLAVDTAELGQFADGSQVRIVAAHVYFATKVSAFIDRGSGDLLGAKDFEDIVALVDGRKTLVEEVRTGPEEVRVFFSRWCAEVLENTFLSDAVSGHVSRASGPGRTELVMERLRVLSVLE